MKTEELYLLLGTLFVLPTTIVLGIRGNNVVLIFSLLLGLYWTIGFLIISFTHQKRQKRFRSQRKKRRRRHKRLRK